MFNQILTIALKEMKQLVRDGGALAALFLLPVVFITVMTLGDVGSQSTKPAKILVVNEDQGAVTTAIIERLKKEPRLDVVDQVGSEPIDQAKAETMLLARDQNYSLLLVFPRHFAKQLQSQRDATVPSNLVTFVVDPAVGESKLNPIESLIKVQVMTVAGALAELNDSPGVLQKILPEKPPQLDTVLSSYVDSARDLAGRIQPNVQFQRVAPQGMVLAHPITTQEQNVPAYTIFGIFFIVQVIGNTILREKESGTFSRLMAAPISRSVILIGKLLPFYLVNIIQVGLMFLFGHFIFGIYLGHSLLGLLIMASATAAVANALGLLIAAISKSTEHMGPLSGMILITLAAVGGLFLPLADMPEFMQQTAYFTPHAWALRGFQDVIVQGYSAVAVLPTAGVLLGFACVFYIIALVRFRFH
jgi:ABC-2 type transport system permease protein